MKNIFTLVLLVSSLAGFAQQRQRSLSREELLNEKYCSALFSTPDGIYFDMENDVAATGAISYLTILDWLQGRVAGLQVYSYRSLRIPFIRNRPATIFVDEMRVDASSLEGLPVSDIAMIKIIKTPFVGAWGAPGGTIAIYTKEGEEEDTE